MQQSTKGAALARALLTGFTVMVDEVVTELEARGHPGVTPTHEFALRAIDEGAQSASDLGRRLGVSKQAAAKTITALEQFGYLAREVDPDDARRRRLVVTSRGEEMTTIGAASFDRIRSRWEQRLGTDRLMQLEADLARIAD